MAVTAEIVDGRIQLATEWRHKELVRNIPGAKWRSELGPSGSWTLPVSWSACLALRSTFGEELEVGEELQLWAKKEKRERIDPCLYLRDLTDYRGDPALYGWQRSGAEFILFGKQVLVADDPGAGKTATAIRGLSRLQSLEDAGHPQGEPVFPCLVVCPNSMKHTWQREFDTWWPGLKVNVIKGTAAKRRKLLEERAHVYVINIESVKGHSRLAPYGSIELTACQEHGGEDPKITPARCHLHEKELNRINFRSVIVDEAHRIKEGKSQQTRAVKAAAGDARVRVALTGTPTANDVTDLWSILNFLAPWEFASKTRWIGRFVETMLNAWGGMVVIGIKAGMQGEFQQVLDTRMRRMSEDVVLSHLPPIIYEQRDVELSPRQAKAYREMRDAMRAQMEDEDTGAATVLTVDSPMTRATRLLQLASSYGEVEVTEYKDEHGFPKIRQKLVLTDPSSKLDTFMDDVDDFGDHQVAVMAVSKQLINMLSARLDRRKIPHGLVTGDQSEDQRQQAIDDFQAGKTQFILFTAAAGGSGITLTAARYLCRLQLPYSFVDFKQSLRRVRRIGSEIHPNIIVIDYVTEGTLDTHVFEALQKKGVSFEEVVRDNAALLRILKEDDA